MDITLSKEQQDIAKEARRFLTKECPFDYVREMYENDQGYTDDIWKKMVEMDWMAMRIPEAYGGLGMDQIDLTMVLEETGRAVLPGPFFSTVMLAAEAIIEAGTEQQKDKYLSAIADGNLKGTLALYEPDSGADLDYIQMPAGPEGQDFILNGTKLSVPDAHVADVIICAARSSEGDDPAHGITLFLVDSSTDGVTVTTLPTMDGSRKLNAVEFINVRLGPESILGEPHQGGVPLQRVLQRAQVGLSAECVGGAQRAMEIANDYAKVRIQYDQPIGAFQAIKHRCAQMFVEAESSRSLIYWAAWTQDHGDEKEAAIAASAAKSYCSETFTHNAAGGIQVLGGTGFTMENEMHLFLKRAKANEMALGDPVYHRERIIRLLTQ
jgi:alkylation response protein AidB-like acyl-CoA dehydrogenase